MAPECFENVIPLESMGMDGKMDFFHNEMKSKQRPFMNQREISICFVVVYHHRLLLTQISLVLAPMMLSTEV